MHHHRHMSVSFHNDGDGDDLFFWLLDTFTVKKPLAYRAFKRYYAISWSE
jgi:hypothetical protein